MNTEWDVLRRLRLDIENSFNFFPAGDELGLFWLTKSKWKSLQLVFESHHKGPGWEYREIIWVKGRWNRKISLVSGLEYSAPPHFLIFATWCNSWREHNWWNHLHRADYGGWGLETSNFKKRIGIRCHLRYCFGRTPCWQCRFGNYPSENTPNTDINETCNRAVCRRRKRKCLKLVPYIRDLTKNLYSISIWSGC